MSYSIDKKKIQECIFDSLSRVEGLVSSTIVGSFVDRNDISVISDIDTIVILDQLTEEKFNQCVDEISRLSGVDLGFPEKKVYINSTFGPLKYDTESQVVVHLMIYDVEGHRKHVLKSPFTCYDWERSRVYRGKLLEEIYPVIKLQPRDFISSRRGLRDYLEDIENGVVSYRKYEFRTNQVQEISDEKILDERHKGEYAFHIIKNLISNYGKMVYKENKLFDHEDFLNFWNEHLGELTYFIPMYEKLQEVKLQRGLAFPEDTVTNVKDFVLKFEEMLNETWIKLPNYDFFRHGKTEFNDGSFLGQGRDPSIIEPPEKLEKMYTECYSSPMKRCVETARALGGLEVLIEERINELNYGLAEGLDVVSLKEKYPAMIELWLMKDDPKYPEGENTQSVYKRLQSFLSELIEKDKTGDKLIVSHNHTLRCLVGSLMDQPLWSWFLIVIPHVKCISLKCYRDEFYLNLDPEVKGIITDSLINYGK